MSKPLKFHQLLNQAPRSPTYGKHRRPDPSSHGHSFDRTDYSAGRSDQGRTVTVNLTRATWVAIDLAYEPEPPAIPYAGIRTGEIIGHRLWWIIRERGERHLCSLAHRRLWQPGETVSGDLNQHIIAFSLSPIWGGTYAFADGKHCEMEIDFTLRNIAEWRRQMQTWGTPLLTFGLNSWMPYTETTTFVRGTIKMWGEVVEHERGYRAEFAKVHSLDQLYGDGNLEALRARYGVA